MPGVTLEEARKYTDPARRELDMVFQFEHVRLDHGARKWDVHPLDLTELKASLGRWQAGLAEVGWNSLYWNNHDQPRVSRASATTARTACARPRCSARCCTCTAARRTSTRARSSG